MAAPIDTATEDGVRRLDEMRTNGPSKQWPVRCSGFTLVELVFAGGLLAVLLSMAVPTFQAATDITGIAARLQLYYEGNHDYPDTLAQAGILGPRDPWEHDYQYLKIFGVPGKGGVRKDKKLNPINSDFDLYSRGPDGESKTQLDNKDSVDDIVRASDGAFVGRASDF